MRTQRVKVLTGFVLGPERYAAPGDELVLPLHDAIREKAAGSVEWLAPEAIEDEPGLTKPPIIETRDPQPLNRDPKRSK